ncbi:MAG: DUF4384 domain-containing protein [bacterium]|nr:DUF4384 domain-containing protein [bacterium]
MWRKGATLLTVVLAMLMTGSTLLAQQQVQRDRSDDRDDGNYESEYEDRGRSDDDYGSNGYVRVDRYLDADIWVNRSDNEYFIGDNIKMHYRLNQDAYVAIVSIDSRGRVNLLYPTSPTDNPWRRGGISYTLPAAEDEFDLVVDGPEGSETIQIIASRERFPIPSWFNGSGITCGDDEDRDEFMDYLISRYFDRYPDQRFAVDREVIYVNEWEQDYFRPVYYPTYPSWSVCGNVYFDYPWGASVYIDGIYWGCAPLYIPRVLVGWRTITVYDRYGYCWEDYVHVSHYNTIVLNQTIIRPRAGVHSKFKDVRVVGYRDPVAAGYKNYNEVVKKRTTVVSRTTADPKNGVTRSKPTENDASNFAALPKKHVRGTGGVIKTDRGYESSAIGSSTERRRSERTASNSRFDGDKSANSRGSYRSGSSGSSSGSSTDRGSYGTTSKKGSSGSSSSGNTVERKKSSESPSGGSSNYYRKKSGSVDNKKEGEKKSQAQPQQVEQKKTESKGDDNNSSSGNRGGGEVKQKSSGSNSSGSSPRQSTPRSSNGNSGKDNGKGKR